MAAQDNIQICQPVDAGADVPPAAPPGAAALPQAARHLHAQERAAAQGLVLVARRAGARPLPRGHRRERRRRRRRRSSGWCSARARSHYDLLEARAERGPARRRHRPPRAALPLPGRRGRRRACPLSQACASWCGRRRSRRTRAPGRSCAIAWPPRSSRTSACSTPAGRSWPRRRAATTTATSSGRSSSSTSRSASRPRPSRAGDGSSRRAVHHGL